METRTKTLTDDLKKAGRDAEMLADETAEVWIAKMKEAGNAAVEGARAAYHTVQEKTVAGAKATDKAIHDRPYIALGVAFGVGLVLGALMNRK